MFLINLLGCFTIHLEKYVWIFWQKEPISQYISKNMFEYVYRKTEVSWNGFKIICLFSQKFSIFFFCLRSKIRNYFYLLSLFIILWEIQILKYFFYQFFWRHFITMFSQQKAYSFFFGSCLHKITNDDILIHLKFTHYSKLSLGFFYLQIFDYLCCQKWYWRTI